MKKLFAIFAILMFAAPAFAADWAFYGSSRFRRSTPSVSGRLLTTQTPTSTTACRATPAWAPTSRPTRSRGSLNWRCGAPTQATAAVNTRPICGQWNFADKTYLKVGKYQTSLIRPTCRTRCSAATTT